MYDKELGIFMYKYKNGLLPKSFDDMFENFESIHNYDTRHKKNYRSQNHKIKQFSVLVQTYGIPFLKMSKMQVTLRILNSSFVIITKNDYCEHYCAFRYSPGGVAWEVFLSTMHFAEFSLIYIKPVNSKI